MAIFVVQAKDGGQAALERARFVRDGFSWPAFAFTQLWLLYHRLWLALLLWVVGEAAFFILVLPHVTLGAALGVDLVTRLWLGSEAGRLRLDKHKAALMGVIEARDRDEAEVAFFRTYLPVAMPGSHAPDMVAPGTPAP